MSDSFKAIATALLFAALSLLFPVQAFAQATRTWVSGVGDDVNPCSRTAPCKTFAGAISKTAAGGEINVLDPGGFGGVTITKSITIKSDSILAGVLVSGTNGITVNVTPTDEVLLEGLDIEGLGSGAPVLTAGLNGIRIIGGGKVTVRKCSIRNFSQNGIDVTGTQGARVFVEDSLLLNNAGGLNIQTTNSGFLRNSLVDNNSSFSVQVAGSSALVLVGSTLSGSPSSILTSAGGAVISYGNNLIRNAGVPTQTLPLQ